MTTLASAPVVEQWKIYALVKAVRLMITLMTS